MLVMYVVPLTILVVLNIAIGLTIHRARLHRHSIVANGYASSNEFTRTSQDFSRTASSYNEGPAMVINGSQSRRTRERIEENEQQNIAIMLMVVVMIFVLCNVLAMAGNILEELEFNAGDLIKISNLLVTLNSSVNLFIYCGFGRKFRREFKKLLGVSSRFESTNLRRCWTRNRDHECFNIDQNPTMSQQL